MNRGAALRQSWRPLPRTRRPKWQRLQAMLASMRANFRCSAPLPQRAGPSCTKWRHECLRTLRTARGGSARPDRGRQAARPVCARDRTGGDGDAPAHRPARDTRRCALGFLSRAGQTHTVFVGDALGSARVIEIGRGCVLLEHDAAIERLCVHEGAVAAPASAPPRRHVALANFAQWTAVRIAPVPNGFKLFGVVAGF